MRELITWLDVETTGREADSDLLLEVAALVTDMEGRVVSTPYHELICLPNVAAAVTLTDEQVRTMHERSGLWQALWSEASLSREEVDVRMAAWLEEAVATFSEEPSILYMGGNSLTLDRNFMKVNMPRTYMHISHRSVDVTSLSLALQHNFSAPPFTKGTSHRALDDVFSAVEEYRHYLTWLRRKLTKSS